MFMIKKNCELLNVMASQFSTIYVFRMSSTGSEINGLNSGVVSLYSKYGIQLENQSVVLVSNRGT